MLVYVLVLTCWGNVFTFQKAAPAGLPESSIDVIPITFLLWGVGNHGREHRERDECHRSFVINDAYLYNCVHTLQGACSKVTNVLQI